MNAYYQMPEEPKGKRRVVMIAAVGSVAVALLIMVVLLARGALAEWSRYPEESGGMADSGLPDEPGLSLTEQESGEPETVGGEGMESDGSAIGGDEADTVVLEESEPDPDRTVSYLSREVVEAWAPQIAECLERIQARMAADEIVWLGLFDFEPDGSPEVVIGRMEGSAMDGGRYVLTVYGLDGDVRADWAVGQEMPVIVHQSRLGKYPCSASYAYQYRGSDSRGNSIQESRFIMIGEGLEACVVYGMRLVGTTVTYTVDGATANRVAYVAQMESVPRVYTELSGTTIAFIRLTTAMDAQERAESLVTLRQEFVCP